MLTVPLQNHTPQIQTYNGTVTAAAVYCSKKVITSSISGSDKYQWVVLVVRWGECSPIVEDIMKVLAPSGLSRQILGRLTEEGL